MESEKDTSKKECWEVYVDTNKKTCSVCDLHGQEVNLIREFNGSFTTEILQDKSLLDVLKNLHATNEIRLYINKQLIFEGEYLDGKRWNGKGIKYDCYGNVELKEEYVNGECINVKRWNGKGIEYDKNSKLFFEGGYLNGKLHGQGKEYNEDGRLIFEGEYLNGERNGKGKEYNEVGELIFEGEYLNGERNGKGKEFYDNGKLEFEGEYLNGKRNGKGKEYGYYGKLSFEGEYLNGERNGKGKDYDYNGDLEFEGEYLNGKWHGQGKEYFNRKLIFAGKYAHNNRWDGKLQLFKDGEIVFSGEYINGKLNGKGKEYHNNGQLKFEGEYLNGKRNGKCKVYDYYGKLHLEGYYLNGQINCKCKLYYSNGNLMFEGEYVNGKRNGKGKEYDNNGDLEFEGEYLNDNREKGTLYDRENIVIKEVTYDIKTGEILTQNIIKETQDDKDAIKETDKQFDFVSANTTHLIFTHETKGKPLFINGNMMLVNAVDITQADKKSLYNAFLQRIRKNPQLILRIAGHSSLIKPNSIGICGTNLTSFTLDNIIETAVGVGVKIIRIENTTCCGANLFNKVEPLGKDYGYNGICFPSDCKIINKDKNIDNRVFLHEQIIQYAQKYPNVKFFYNHCAVGEHSMEKPSRAREIIPVLNTSNEQELSESMIEKQTNFEEQMVNFYKTNFNYKKQLDHIDSLILDNKKDCVIELNKKLTEEEIMEIIENSRNKNKDKEKKNQHITIKIGHDTKINIDQLNLVINTARLYDINCVIIDNYNNEHLKLYDECGKFVCNINEYIETFYKDLIKNKKNSDEIPDFTFYSGQFRKSDTVEQIKDKKNDIPFYLKFSMKKENLYYTLKQAEEWDTSLPNSKIYRLRQQNIEVYANDAFITRVINITDLACRNILMKDVDAEIEKLKKELLSNNISKDLKEKIEAQLKTLDEKQKVKEKEEIIKSLRLLVVVDKQKSLSEKINHLKDKKNIFKQNGVSQTIWFFLENHVGKEENLKEEEQILDKIEKLFELMEDEKIDIKDKDLNQIILDLKKIYLTKKVNNEPRLMAIKEDIIKMLNEKKISQSLQEEIVKETEVLLSKQDYCRFLPTSLQKIKACIKLEKLEKNEKKLEILEKEEKNKESKEETKKENNYKDYHKIMELSKEILSSKIDDCTISDVDDELARLEECSIDKIIDMDNIIEKFKKIAIDLKKKQQEELQDDAKQQKDKTVNNKDKKENKQDNSIKDKEINNDNSINLDNQKQNKGRGK